MTTTQRTAPDYRAETVGSLLRPEWLLDARDAYAEGRYSSAEFKRLEDRAVDEVLALQEEAGLDVVTDGEMRRGHFTGAVSEVVSGMEDVPAAGVQWRSDHGGSQQAHQHKRTVTSTLRRVRSMAQEEFTYVRAKATRPVKVTLPSPLMMHIFWSTEHSTQAYRDPFEMFADAADITRREIEELAGLGCEYIQIDAPELATLVDDSTRESYRERGIDPDRMLGEGVELLNDLARSSGVRFGLHLCRGNREGRWMAAGGYEAISSDVFKRTPNFTTFFLEYDDERSGGFAPLADLPDDKLVVLGLVTTKRPELEDAEQLLARIDEAARHTSREQLAISPQCGFATAIRGNPLDMGQQRAKLQLVRDVAARAWPHNGGRGA